MFVCVATYRAKADEEDAIIALHENWDLQQCIKADDNFSCELLRGILDPRKFITIVHCQSKEIAQAVVNDLKQHGLYGRLESLVEGELKCADYTSEWQLHRKGAACCALSSFLPSS